MGKSTTTNELVRALRAHGHRVGVLAVDPSSPFTGGAILGDRVRMQDHATDPGVYIRSMSSRGHLGGLAAATPQAVRVLEGAGCDVVLVETVGVGQAEVEVASLADTTLVLLAPGMGDAIQAVKAGILEIADVFVVNKADRDGADATYRDIQGMIAPRRARARASGGRRSCGRSPSRGEGIDDVVAAIDKHRALAGRARRAAPPAGGAGRRRDRGDRAGRRCAPGWARCAAVRRCRARRRGRRRRTGPVRGGPAAATVRDSRRRRTGAAAETKPRPVAAGKVRVAGRRFASGEAGTVEAGCVYSTGV